MNSSVKLLGLLIFLAHTVEASTIYQNDFSASNQPRFNWEIGGLAAPSFDLSVSPSLQSEADNQYARLDVTTVGGYPSAPWRWYGGWYDAFAGQTSFPNQFTFSFDLLHAPVEKIRLTLEADSSQGPGLLRSVLRTYWLQPQGAGWQHLTIDQNTPYSESTANWHTSESPMFRMNIFLASHDNENQPLSIATDGTHSFFVDNVQFTVVPEPSAFALCGLAASAWLIRRRS